MGVNISQFTLIQRARIGIIYSFQIPALFENLTAEDNIRLSLLTRKKETFNFFQKLDRIQGVKEEARKILKMFNVPENLAAGELPHGQRKLLDSAIAYALNQSFCFSMNLRQV